MEKINCKPLDLFETARQKVNITRLALDKAIEDSDGNVEFDVVDSVLMLINEAHEALQSLQKPFYEMNMEINALLEEAHPKFKKVA